MSDARGTHTISNGLRDYREPETRITGSYLRHEYEPEGTLVVAGGRLPSANRLEMVLQLVQGGFGDTVTQ